MVNVEVKIEAVVISTSVSIDRKNEEIIEKIMVGFFLFKDSYN